MIHRFKLILIFSVVAFLTGCSSKPVEYSKITNNHKRIEMLGVSLLPPQQDGWLLGKVHFGKFKFSKYGINTSQTFTGQVSLAKLPDVENEQEFLELVSKQRSRDSGNPRFEDLIRDEKFTNEKDTYGVIFHSKYKDYKAKNLPKGADYLIIEDIGIILQHPDDKNVGVFIALSQRSLESDLDANFKGIAKEFIDNAILIPLVLPE